MIHTRQEVRIHQGVQKGKRTALEGREVVHIVQEVGQRAVHTAPEEVQREDQTGSWEADRTLHEEE